MLASILDYAIFVAVVPIVLLIVTVVVTLARAKARMRLENGEDVEESKPGIHVITDATEADQIAYSIAERYRKRIWRRFSINTSFGVAGVSDLCGSLISEIAHVYYPNSRRPELEVTINDLLGLTERVTARLRKLLERFPMNRLQGVRISQIQDYQKLYSAVSGNVLVRSIRNKWARRAARSAAIAARYANPKFWIMRGVTRGGREFAARYFLTTVVTIAGEEAVLLYRQGASDAEQPIEPKRQSFFGRLGNLFRRHGGSSGPRETTGPNQGTPP
jgi:hypothetical protein